MTLKYSVAIIAGQLVVGGAERQLYLWLSHLDRARFQPVVVTLHPGYKDHWESPIEALGIPLLRLPRRRSKLLRLLEITRALAPYKPQLIHGWHSFASPYAGVAAKLLGAKSLGGVRGMFRAFCDHSTEVALTLRLVDAILANSVSAAEQLKRERKHDRQMIYTVQNAVEDQAQDRLRAREELSQRFGLSTAEVWIGSLARLDPGKRFDLLFKVLGLLREDIRDFHFLLIGAGPERLRLEKMADELGINEFITFAGEIPGASAWLSALDIFCFPSLEEGLPNAVMESAMAGVPIVAWRVPFMQELLDDGKGALLVDPEDITAFHETLIKLIHSPALRVKLGKDGRAHMLEKFSLDCYVRRMTDVYEDVLGVHVPSMGES